MNTYIQSHQTELSNVIDFFKKDISSIRTGRANPAMLDGVQIESYGSRVPLQQVGTINVVDAQCMTVTPWDKNALRDIEKGIVEADLGVNPVNEGDKIRLTLPQPTEEDRKNRVKKLNEKFEQARVKLRGVRGDIKEAVEKAAKDKEITEDDKARCLKEMEEEVKKYGEQLEETRSKKEKEIMTI